MSHLLLHHSADLSYPDLLFIRFVPSMGSILYHGSKNERREIRKKFMPKQAGPKFPVVVTSYEVVLNDASVLAQYRWKYVVVDEVILCYTSSSIHCHYFHVQMMTVSSFVCCIVLL